MSIRTPTLGPLELQIIGLMRTDKPKSVGETQEALKAGGHGLAYTTVMTVMTRLFEKGHVKRKKNGRQYLYWVTADKDKLRKSIFNNVRVSLFQNERIVPIKAMIEQKGFLSKEELIELRDLIDARLKSAKDLRKLTKKERLLETNSVHMS
jgi:predicted transcriptional regulator